MRIQEKQGHMENIVNVVIFAGGKFLENVR